MPAGHVFICWAHADAEQVLEEVAWLQDNGVAVWYDEGISPGAEWREELGEAIRACRLFLYFVTPSSIASANCRRELNFALEQDRPILAVHLQETQMSDGMRLSLNDRQAILRYAERDADYRRKLLDSVVRADAGPAGAGSATEPHRWTPARRRRARTIASAVGMVLVGALIGWLASSGGERPPAEEVRFEILVDEPPGLPWSRQISVSEDGRKIAYAQPDGTIVRDLASLQPSILPFGEGPHFSPDGRWLAFEGQSRVAISGGAVQPLVNSAIRHAGAAWISVSSIVFAEPGGLYQVSLEDRSTELLLEPDTDQGEQLFGLPEAIPHSNHVLFTIAFEDGFATALLDLTTLEHEVVLPGAHSAKFVSSGHLVYARGTDLMAVRYDTQRMQVVGESVALNVQVFTSRGGAQFDVSPNGSLAYLRAPAPLPPRLVWVKRDGVAEPVGAPDLGWVYPRISPDGQFIAADIFDEIGRNIHVWDVQRGGLVRLTDGRLDDLAPIWSPDSTSVYFASERTGVTNVFLRSADAAAPARQVLQADHWQNPNAFVAGGEQLLIVEDQGAGFDISVVSLKDPTDVREVIATPYNEHSAEISPDGRWLIYTSDVSGKDEVYVRPWPDVERKLWKVSIDGGRHGMWSPVSDEVFFIDGKGQMQSVEWSASEDFEIESTTALFPVASYITEGAGARHYDVSPVDGRFLMKQNMQPDGGWPQGKIVVAVNFHEELERLLPWE